MGKKWSKTGKVLAGATALGVAWGGYNLAHRQDHALKTVASPEISRDFLEMTARELDPSRGGIPGFYDSVVDTATGMGVLGRVSAGALAAVAVTGEHPADGASLALSIYGTPEGGKFESLSDATPTYNLAGALAVQGSGESFGPGEIVIVPREMVKDPGSVVELACGSQSVGGSSPAQEGLFVCAYPPAG